MKKKLLILHGALGSAQQMSPLADLLKQHYEVFTYDFPGHGGKPFPESELSMPVIAKHLHEYLLEFELMGCTVFGYSMGGYAALWLESHEQGTFGSIMTFGTKFDWSPEIAEGEVSFLNAEKMEEKVPAFAKQLENRHLPNNWKKVLHQTAHLLTHLGKHAMSTADFGNINCKVRLTIGDRDQMITLDETARTFKELNHASLCIFPETSHPIEKVNLNILADELQRFIS